MTTGLFATCNISPSRFFEGRAFKEGGPLSLNDLLKLSLLNFLPSYLTSNSATSSRQTTPANLPLPSSCISFVARRVLKAKSRIIPRAIVVGAFSQINGCLSSIISSTRKQTPRYSLSNSAAQSSQRKSPLDSFRLSDQPPQLSQYPARGVDSSPAS